VKSSPPVHDPDFDCALEKTCRNISFLNFRMNESNPTMSAEPQVGSAVAGTGHTHRPRRALCRQPAGIGPALLSVVLVFASHFTVRAQSLIETNPAPALLEKGRLAGGGAVAVRALAIIYTGDPDLTMGFSAENPISFAGSPGRQYANALSITPTLTWNLPDNWFAGNSDFKFIFDWENNGRATIPVGAQVGRVFNIGRMPVGLSQEAAANVVRPSDAGVPDWQINIEFTLIFKTLRKSHTD
jgi:hypothetical protein